MAFRKVANLKWLNFSKYSITGLKVIALLNRKILSVCVDMKTGALIILLVRI